MSDAIENITTGEIAWLYHCLKRANKAEDHEKIETILRNFEQRFPQYLYFNDEFWKKL